MCDAFPPHSAHTRRTEPDPFSPYRPALHARPRHVGPQIQWGVFRVYAVEAGIKQPKYVYFMWAGPRASIKTRVNATALKSSVLKAFEVRAETI
jgi:hypothetical protein